jgi:hypothetical protein
MPVQYSGVCNTRQRDRFIEPPQLRRASLPPAIRAAAARSIAIVAGRDLDDFLIERASAQKRQTN